MPYGWYVPSGEGNNAKALVTGFFFCSLQNAGPVHRLSPKADFPLALFQGLNLGSWCSILENQVDEVLDPPFAGIKSAEFVRSFAMNMPQWYWLDISSWSWNARRY